MKLKTLLFNLIEVLLIPFTLIAGIWMRTIRKAGFHRAKLSKKILLSLGVMPIRDHYYDPLINPEKHLTKPLNEDRLLPGINLNTNAQLALLKELKYGDELLALPIEPTGKPLEYYYNNLSYRCGDGEFLYNVIRHFKPKQIMEIGSGNSTLMALNAINKNKEEDANYSCALNCIEPYEQPWLEKTSANIIREKIEEVNLDLFKNLEANDILFIDSSHMIRPQGDVLHEYLTLLPLIKPGVIVHIHDIFTPKDYPKSWIMDEHRLWNEQYLLEAFLNHNSDFEILAALNYLTNNHYDEFTKACPVMLKFPEAQPGSFWMRRK